MEAASVVERRATGGTSGDRQVGVDSHRPLADTAENGILVALILRPRPRRMTSGLIVAQVAWIEALAAGEPDRHDIMVRCVMHASGLGVDRPAVDVHAQRSHVCPTGVPCCSGGKQKAPGFSGAFFVH
jgi:hypothetical protein